MYIGQLRAAGLAKESIVGTLVTPPTEYLPYIPPDSFHPAITLLESKEVRALADTIYKASQGPGDLKGMKLKFEAEPENIGNHLMACFGTDTVTEKTSFVIGSTNNKIDFKESGGSQLHATIASATYAMGASSAVNGSLCKAIKTALEGASGATLTYTVTFSGNKVTITPTTGTIQILWLTGTNQANGAYAILGFSHTDTSDAASVTSDGTTANQDWTHTFTRLQAAQLPTYSWWFDKGAAYPQFLGCMLSKLDLTVKAKEFVIAESEWTGLSYDTTGTSKSPSYSAVKPWKFDQCVVNIDGSPVLNYDNLKISFDNMVEAEHCLSGSIYANKIYSKGFEVTVSLDFVVEDVTQYNKYIAGNSAAMNFVLTSADDISGGYAGTKYSLTIDIPTVQYSAAPYPNAPGLLKISFTAKGIYTVASTKTVSAALVNSVSASY